MTHDDKRNGTTTMFAAPNVLTGEVFGRNMCRLKRHPCRTFHFTPTPASWPNAVEGFFAELTGRRLKHGIFCPVVDLQVAINRFIKQHTETEAKPFTLRADPDQIIAARNRGFQMLESIH